MVHRWGRIRTNPEESPKETEINGVIAPPNELKTVNLSGIPDTKLTNTWSK
jgi:hypothetical protein